MGIEVLHGGSLDILSRRGVMLVLPMLLPNVVVHTVGTSHECAAFTLVGVDYGQSCNGIRVVSRLW
jgi:hypothetical protein